MTMACLSARSMVNRENGGTCGDGVFMGGRGRHVVHSAMFSGFCRDSLVPWVWHQPGLPSCVLGAFNPVQYMGKLFRIR